jgi:hypothetical protein
VRVAQAKGGVKSPLREKASWACARMGDWMLDDGSSETR